MKRTIIITVGFAIFLICCGIPFIADPSFREGETRLSTLAILPARFDVTFLSMKGKALDLKYSARMEEIIPSLVEEQFKAKGYKTVNLDVSPEALSQNQDLQTAYRELMSNHEKYYQKLLEEKIVNMRIVPSPYDLTLPSHWPDYFPLVYYIKEKKWAQLGPFNIGEACAPLSDRVRADGLVFIRGQGQVESAGRELARAAAMMPLTIISGGEVYAESINIGRLNITVVDGRSGRVLAEVYVVFYLVPQIENVEITRVQEYTAACIGVVFKKFPEAGNGADVSELYRKPLLLSASSDISAED